MATNTSQKRYPPELRERAIRMVHEAIATTGERHGVITRVARQLGIGTESRSATGSTSRRSTPAPAG